MRSLWNAPRKRREDEWLSPSAKAWPSPDDENWDYPDTGSAASPKVDKPRRQTWMEGGKFTWRDGLGLALTTFSDAMAAERGAKGDTTDDLFKRAYSAKAMAKKAQAEAVARAASAQRMTAARPDLNPFQIDAVSYGDLTPEQAMPRQPDVPAFVKNLEAWNQMTPEKRREVEAMQAVLNPGYYNGQDGRRYQNAPPPPDFIPDDPAPAPMAGSSVNTPPELEAMRQLYLRQLGPVDGEAAFREYAKSLRR